jgi:hypothetical protein
VATDVLDPVIGDPVDVSAAGRTLQSIALDVANIAARLRALAAGNDEWSGTAARSAQARSATVPPKLDKAHMSYAAAGNALSSYARSLADAQQQSETAIAAAGRAGADLDAARTAQAAAASRDAAAAATARAAGLPVPPALAPRYEASIDDAATRLSRASAMNDHAHEQQSQAARVAAAALQQASRIGIHNASWLHHVTHAVGHWASTRWASALHDVAKVANVVSALAGMAALVLAVAGVFFPPLEAAAAALEAVSLVSAVVAGAADTALAVTGKSSWGAVGVDALTLAPAGLGRVVTKAAPLIRESRLITPTAVVHASTGDARKLTTGLIRSHIPVTNGNAGTERVINYRPKDSNPDWGLTTTHLEKHFFGDGPLSLSSIDPAGNYGTWIGHLRDLSTRPVTTTREGGIQDIMGTFEKTDGSGKFRLGIRISPKDEGSFDLVTVLTIQRKRRA